MGADAEPLSIPLMDFLVKRIRIIGGSQNGPEYLYEALDYVAQGKVKPIIERTLWSKRRRRTSVSRQARRDSAPSSQCKCHASNRRGFALMKVLVTGATGRVGAAVV